MNIIEELRSIDLQKEDPNNLIKLVHQLFPLPIGMIKIPPELSIYRARINTASQDFFYQADIANPPQSYTDGRAHFKSQSMFYGSIKSKDLKYGYVTAAIETSKICNNKDIIEGTEELTIGKWDILDDLWVQTIAQSQDILNPDFKYAGMFSDIRKLYNSMDPTCVEMFKRLDYIVSEYSRYVGVNDDHQYKTTACFANLIFQDERIEGLLYPSVATSLKGLNVALKPCLVDKKIKLTQVLKIRIYKKETILIQNLKCAEINPITHEFNWQEASLHEKISLEEINTILNSNFLD